MAMTDEQTEAIERCFLPLAKHALERAIHEWSLAERQSPDVRAQAERYLLSQYVDDHGDPETSGEMYACVKFIDERRRSMVADNKTARRQARNKRKRGRKR